MKSHIYSHCAAELNMQIVSCRCGEQLGRYIVLVVVGRGVHRCCNGGHIGVNAELEALM